MFWNKKSEHIKDLTVLLGNPSVQEDLLGIKDVKLPTADQIISDAAKLSNYSTSADYKRFAQEVWGRVIMHLDKILDDKASHDTIKFHSGALKESLDLLRLSYQARSVLEQTEIEASDTSHR